MSVLEKIKRRPDNQKSFFSLLTAIVLTLIIVALWLSFSVKSAGKEVAEDQNSLSSISPIKMIKDEISKAISDYQEANIDKTASAIDVLLDEGESGNFVIGTSTDTDILEATSSDKTATGTATTSKKTN